MQRTTLSVYIHVSLCMSILQHMCHCNNDSAKQELQEVHSVCFLSFPNCVGNMFFGSYRRRPCYIVVASFCFWFPRGIHTMFVLPNFRCHWSKFENNKSHLCTSVEDPSHLFLLRHSPSRRIRAKSFHTEIDLFGEEASCVEKVRLE